MQDAKTGYLRSVNCMSARGTGGRCGMGRSRPVCF